MGCDIHLKLEIRLKQPREYKHKIDGVVKTYYVDNDTTSWSNCKIPNKCWGDRIYGMFAVMADVRNYGRYNRIVPDRGYPKDACYQTDNAYYRIIYKEKGELPTYLEDAGYVTEETAKKWASRYECTIFEKKYKNETVEFVTYPDWHSANWCTTAELEDCINTVFKDENGDWVGDYLEWTALLGTMKGYEMSGEYECRAVYWFDN